MQDIIFCKRQDDIGQVSVLLLVACYKLKALLTKKLQLIIDLALFKVNYSA